VLACLFDAIAVLACLFADAGPLPEPFVACGPDGTEDDLGCLEYTGC
jgi:hypothetical protein